MPCRQRQQLGSHARPSRRWARPSAPLWRSPRTPRAHEPFRSFVGARGAHRRRCYVDEGCSAGGAGGGWRHAGGMALGLAPARSFACSIAVDRTARRRSHRSPSIAPLCALAAHSLARVVVRRSSAVSGRKVIAAAGCGGWEDILLSSPRAFSKSTFRRRSLAWPQSGVARGLSPQGLSIKRRRPLAHREGCEPPCVVAVCRVRASATARPR